MSSRLLGAFKKLVPQRIFLFLLTPYHFLLAFFAAVFYFFPSRHLVVIGITGTKGKTTVVDLLHEILEYGGAKVASASSLRFRVGQNEIRNELKMTMPGRFFVQKFLRDAVRAGCKYAILEVTSEGIKQFRHRFIKFDVAAVTNISPEHIETHGSFEKYLRAKLDLFWRLSKEGMAVINREDKEWQRFSASTGAHKIFYSQDAILFHDRRCVIRDLRINVYGLSFELDDQAVSSSLLGEFNFYNILTATTVALSQHVTLDKIAAAILKVIQVPGRMEFVQREPFAVVVDYAHTPDSLRGVYEFLRSIHDLQPPTHKLICVLGATGGGRDKWKRPEMGKVAAEFCEEMILTNEDPYDENPQSIMDDIESGFSSNLKSPTPSYKKIFDRREAIREALKLAKSGDAVIITGKGAEPWIMGPDDTKIPWDDREVVRVELARLKK